MMEILIVFSTHGRKLTLSDILKYAYIFVNFIVCVLVSVEAAAVAPYQCHDVQCIHGVCREGRCVCDQGWQGNGCHRCGGRVKIHFQCSNNSRKTTCCFISNLGHRITFFLQ
ncbi:UNVERIFIED_CONTAM: hypothetical protein NCL1_12663 [Trichonephila clavipes]